MDEQAGASHHGPGTRDGGTTAVEKLEHLGLTQDLLSGDVVALAKTQAGSKYLQRFLQERNRSAMDHIFHQVEPALASLMCDKYGNYLCSQVFVASGQRYRRRLLGKILPKITTIACDKRGTHALQALIQVLGSGEGSTNIGDPCVPFEQEHQPRDECDRKGSKGHGRTMEVMDMTMDSSSSDEEPYDVHPHHHAQSVSSLDFIDEQQVKFVRALSKDLAVCAMDPNGTHAIQKTLQCFREPATDLVLREILDCFLELAHNAHGLCVLKVCITCSVSPHTNASSTSTDNGNNLNSHRNSINGHRHAILNQLTLHALDLVQSPYGNYAVQHALEEYGNYDTIVEQHACSAASLGDSDGATTMTTTYTGVCAPLLEALTGRYAHLSVQKFSSNVVEKILMLGPNSVRRTVIEELVLADRMAVVVSSVYGQYVVKRALKVATAEQQAELQRSIADHLDQVSNRQMRLKWKKMIHAKLGGDGDD